MTRHPVHQPPTRPGAIVDPPTTNQLSGQQLVDLTPAQQAELQALVTRAVAIATTQHLHDHTPSAQPAPSPLAEPGVWIVLVMTALVALVAIVALGTVFGLSIIGA